MSQQTSLPTTDLSDYTVGHSVREPVTDEVGSAEMQMPVSVRQIKASPKSKSMISSAPLNVKSTADILLAGPQSASVVLSDSVSFTRNGSFRSKEDYKIQRKQYAEEKKRAERELQSTLHDDNAAVVVLSDWLKVRGTLKSWTKLWCILKPALLIIYRTPKAKSKDWVGTVTLTACELIERPSKKDGFCFKLYHPMDKSIWSPWGPRGETLGAVTQPLPQSHLICRTPTYAAGKCWMDALELAMRCSTLLLSSIQNKRHSSGGEDDDDLVSQETKSVHSAAITDDSDTLIMRPLGNKAYDGLKPALTDDISVSSQEVSEEEISLDDSDASESSELCLTGDQRMTRYVANAAGGEVFGSTKDQTEEMSEENKSIVWFLIKQVRPGMDLSRVVLPSFILEPRSFLDKLSDYQYHADILEEAVNEECPLRRMLAVVRWYLSGFYKKPKGLKKPYNPILGEVFRCYWLHPDGSKTFYVAEQVSHHPPISAFYVTNRKVGFVISASILARSKFYGNSVSAVLDGQAQLTLLNRGETYTITLPYAHCKGILIGTLNVELAGNVTIECKRTSYTTELEFKLKPFFGGSEMTNAISGKIKRDGQTLASLDGHWDSLVTIKDKRTHEERPLWHVNEDIKSRRLIRYTVPEECQESFESATLWTAVSDAIVNEDQVRATVEKTKLEDKQREEAKARLDPVTGVPVKEWQPRLFAKSSRTFVSPEGSVPIFTYRHADLRPWDHLVDVDVVESEFKISTVTKTPPITKGKKSVSLKTAKSHHTSTGESDVTSDFDDRCQSTPNGDLPDLSREDVERLCKQLDQVQAVLTAHLCDVAARLAEVNDRINSFGFILTALAMLVTSIVIFFNSQQ